jgi:choline dehydrogenase-like flavoprotein
MRYLVSAALAGAVRDIDGLRVVDASIFPVQAARNAHAATMAMASVGSDLVLEDS